MIITKDISKKFYKISYEYLLNNLPQGITKEILETYLISNHDEYDNLNNIFKKLTESSRNYQSMPNTINYTKNKDIIDKILCEYDYKKILKKYNVDLLYEEFKNNITFNNNTSKKNNWYKWTSSIIDSAEFISQFETIDDFKNYINCFSYNELTKLALPFSISIEIKGIGYAIACDFLKEIGLEEYCKPDTHIIDVLSKVGFFTKNENNLLKTQCDAFKTCVKLAKEAEVTPYRLDKIIWLICTGEYYMHNIKTIRRKKEYIEYLKNELGE